MKSTYLQASSNALTSAGMMRDAFSSSVAGGISMLDISTRLRITEAELAIVRREVSELLAERNSLETQCQR